MMISGQGFSAQRALTLLVSVAALVSFGCSSQEFAEVHGPGDPRRQTDKAKLPFDSCPTWKKEVSGRCRRRSPMRTVAIRSAATNTNAAAR